MELTKYDGFGNLDEARKGSRKSSPNCRGSIQMSYDGAGESTLKDNHLFADVHERDQ